MAKVPTFDEIAEVARKAAISAGKVAGSVATVAGDEAWTGLQNLGDVPGTIRLGVTGLSRSGKTIFITSLINNLITKANLDKFTPARDGRLISAEIVPHRSKIPAFPYAANVAKLAAGDAREWPEPTSDISEIWMLLKFHAPRKWYRARPGERFLLLNVVDYPGEWLLDLPLLSWNYEKWSLEAFDRAESEYRRDDAKGFLDTLDSVDPSQTVDETTAAALAKSFADYLIAGRKDGTAMSSLPPGRFLMPGKLAGEPELVFAPLRRPPGELAEDSYYRVFERRYESYKDKIVKPFFREHFVRLDRQIVLVDALQAMNAGRDAVRDLRQALEDVLECFRQGPVHPLLRPFYRRIDKVLFAATKADHLHSGAHDLFKSILVSLVGQAKQAATGNDVETGVLAIASVRATAQDEGVVIAGKERNIVIGTPQPGESMIDERGKRYVFDGKTEVEWFVGELPKNFVEVLNKPERFKVNFIRFMPPYVDIDAHDRPILPHQRLDEALEFLIGDLLK